MLNLLLVGTQLPSTVLLRHKLIVVPPLLLNNYLRFLPVDVVEGRLNFPVDEQTSS